MKFYAELYNLNGELVGVSQVVSYADLVNGQYVYQEMSSSGMSSPYLFMGHVPEPTGESSCCSASDSWR